METGRAWSAGLQVRREDRTGERRENEREGENYEADVKRGRRLEFRARIAHRLRGMIPVRSGKST
jgi:hypothetical protein